MASVAPETEILTLNWSEDIEGGKLLIVIATANIFPTENDNKNMANKIDQKYLDILIDCYFINSCNIRETVFVCKMFVTTIF